MYDVIIVGGGPAGISAAQWCGELGLDYCLVERSSSLGGQLTQIHLPITNYPGLRSIDGTELLSRLIGGLPEDPPPRLSMSVSAISLDPILVTDGVEELRARSLIVATGVRRRELDVPGEKDFAKKGMLTSGARDPFAVSGHNVAIIGGGDAALENAIILSAYAEKVLVIHRRGMFSARVEFVHAASSKANIEFMMNSVVEEFLGTEELEIVRVRNVRTDGSEEIRSTRALVRIGVVPNSDVVSGHVPTDHQGYIQIDSTCRTGIEGVYAIGDVASPLSPTIVTATGMGATAAKAVSAWLNPKSTI